MTPTIEELEAALEVFEAMVEYGERQMECPFEDLLNNLDVGSAKKTIRAVLQQAIESKRGEKLNQVAAQEAADDQ